MIIFLKKGPEKEIMIASDWRSIMIDPSDRI
jgi:hypothetical protein